MIAQRHLEPSRCRCGAEAAHPLPICQACYAAIQDAQRNRGRCRVTRPNLYSVSEGNLRVAKRF